MLAVVPELESILLDQVGVAGRLAHDLPCGLLFVVDAERGRRPDERGAGGRVAEGAELAVLEEAVGVELGRDQPHLQVGQAGTDERDRRIASEDGRMEPVLVMSARRHPTIFPASASISGAFSARSEPEGSIKGSIPTARWDRASFRETRSAALQRFCRAL